MNQKKFFISTPIYYSSGKPHIGHTYTTVIADVLARYKRLFGYDVFFVTGMDEHGQKIQQKAEEQNTSPKALVDQIANYFLDLWSRLDIKMTKFIRTTEIGHEEAVQKAFSYLLKQNKIYLGNWVGYYCVSCEENYNEANIIYKDDVAYCSLNHKLEQRNEESYFYKISENAQFLKDYYSNNPSFILPSERVNELVNNFINDLEDLSISRTTFDWGIPIIENPSHVIYVWLDALLNYVTATGYLSVNDQMFKHFWCDDSTEIVHLLSKEIARFHCIYWPIFLKDLGIRLPSTILSHGWIITKEGKMSKSLGNVIDPVQVIANYGSDALRYYLMSDLGLFRDSVFSDQNLIETFNTHLANNYGNMVTRTIGMLKKYFNYKVPKLTKINQIIKDSIQTNKEQLINHINNFTIDKAVLCVQNILNDANKLIEESKPWELAKNNQNKELANLMNTLVKVIHTSTVLLSPILTKGYKQVCAQMNFKPEIITLSAIDNDHLFDDHLVNEANPIFVRINTKE